MLALQKYYDSFGTHTLSGQVTNHHDFLTIAYLSCFVWALAFVTEILPADPGMTEVPIIVRLVSKRIGWVVGDLVVLTIYRQIMYKQIYVGK